MTSRPRRRPRRKPGEYAPTTVRLPVPLVEAVRAEYPAARLWSDSQVAAACLAMAVQARQPPRTGLVHSE